MSPQWEAASEIARLVRTAAQITVGTPGWGTSLLIDLAALEGGEVAKPVESTFTPVRREPRGELVRVDFNPASGVARAHDLIDAILKETLPFVIGVGEVVAKDTTEGFVIFALDDCVEGGGHDPHSEIEDSADDELALTSFVMTDAMLLAGRIALAEYAPSEDDPEATVWAIYQSVEAARVGAVP